MRKLSREQLIMGKRILKEAYGLIRDCKVHFAGYESSERLSVIAQNILGEIERLDNLLEMS